MDSNIRFPDIKPLRLERQAKIVAMGVGLPDRVMTNQNIIDEYGLIATNRAVEYSIGIRERRWAEVGSGLEKLLAAAAKQCLQKAGISIDQVSRVIYTKLLGECQIPAVTVALLRELGASKGIPAFDISSACSGFIHVMDLALRFIATGDDYVLVLGGGISSGGIQQWKKPNPKSVFLFGDGTAAMLLGPAEKQHFLASYIFTSPRLYDNAYIPLGTELLKGDLQAIDYDMFNMRILDGNLILQGSVDYAKVVTEKLLAVTGLTLNDIDFFITSDQSTKIWEAQLEALGIPKEKSVSMFNKYGNTVAAMSPLNLNELIESGRLKRGGLVMMQAHGAGASSGGMIFRY